MKRRKFIAALVGLPAFAKAAVSLRAAPTPPAVNLQLVSSPVVARPLRLKAVWTCEMEQDLNVMYGIDFDDIAKEVVDNYLASVVKPE